MEDQQVEINIFRGYIADMITVKEYAPCTINLRIRPLKCYLKWLYDEGYISINYSNKIKLVRVPQDTIQPLSDKNVKKLLKQPNKETYAGYSIREELVKVVHFLISKPILLVHI